MPLFSIIIPVYNSSITIKNCIDSIVKQTFSDYEVLIFDNLSTDNSLNIIHSYKDDRIIIHSEKDSGVYDAMNKGIDEARGEWLYFLGSDDVLYDENVLSNVLTHIQSAEWDVVYGDAYFIGRKYFHAGEFSRQRLNNELNICHQAIFYKKSVFDRLGYYNLNFPINADWDFNLRCFSTPDLKIKYIDLPIVEYNDISGLSDSGQKDINFHEISGAASNRVINDLRSELERQKEYINRLEGSKTFRVGKVIMFPFRLLKRFFE